MAGTWPPCALQSVLQPGYLSLQGSHSLATALLPKCYKSQEWCTLIVTLNCGHSWFLNCCHGLPRGTPIDTTETLVGLEAHRFDMVPIGFC